MSAAKELAERALAAVIDAGALGAEVLVTDTREQSWQTRAGGRMRSNPDIHTTASHAAGLTLRAYRDGGRTAEHQVNAADLGALQTRLGAAASHAVAAADAAAPDPLAGPPDRMDIQTRGMSICDPRRDRLEDDDRRDILSWNWGTARSVNARLRPRQFTLEEQLTERSFASSRGVLATEVSTRYRVFGEVTTSARGDDRAARGSVTSRHFADIASRPLGAELGNRLEAGERTTRMPAESLPLVIEPHLVASLLALLPPAFDATRLENGTSCLRDHFGTRVAPSGLHIVDDASVASGLHTRAFDDRGVPPIPLPLLRDGVPTGVYVDPEQARRRDSRPTGHRGRGGRLWAGNLLLRPGSRTRNMLFADIPRYLVAIDTITPPQLDIETGRLVIDVWLLLDGHERNPGKLGAYRIETTLNGLLASASQVASDQSRYDGVVACTVITEGLPLAAL